VQGRTYAVSTSASADVVTYRSRSELASAVHAFFVRLKHSEDVARKRQSKLDPDQQASHIEWRSKDPKVFKSWLLEDFVGPGLATARRRPVVRAILALTILGIYLNIFGTDEVVHKAVFTSDRVEALFACQASEFTEVRSKARAM